MAGFADKVIFNSVGQLRAHGAAVGDVPLGLRVNPGVSYSHFDLADPARKHSRLGVTDDAELRAVAGDLTGLMFHFNCENEDLDALRAAVEVIADRYADVLHQMEWVSLGGGISFTTPGYPVDEFSALLRDLADRFGVQIYLEPGEAAITGHRTTRDDRARRRAQRGRHRRRRRFHRGAHARSPDLRHASAGRCADRPDRTRSRSPAARASPVTCSGSSRWTQPLRVGDEVRFADAAGYTMVKTTWFNGLRMPSIVVRRLDGDVEVVREFGYDDFERSLS